MKKLLKLFLFSSLVLFVCLFLFVIYYPGPAFGQEDSDNEKDTQINEQETYLGANSGEAYTVENTDDLVYALANINLRSEPSIKGDVIRVADYGEGFRRTGITSNGWDRLALPDGTECYSLSVCYSINKPDMGNAVSMAGNENSAGADIGKERFVLFVTFISQLPELPTGCEITALATVLNYLGYNISKETLSDAYLPKGEAGVTSFYTAFIGNPRNPDSYGCYAGAIIAAANNYFSAVGGTHTVYDISGYSKEQLYNEVRAGSPVVIWGTIDNVEPYYTASWNIGTEKLKWLAGEHCFVLIGYDTIKDTVIVTDSLYGIMEYDATLFFTRYQQMYSQALLIK